MQDFLPRPAASKDTEELSTYSNESVFLYPCTKFLIPQMQSVIVERELLSAKLDEILEKKLSLVYSPAGFGKTTLISHWIYQMKQDGNTVWITLGSSDNDIYSFWYCMAYGLSLLWPKHFDECICMFRSYSPYKIVSIQNMLVNLLAELNTDVIIVIDNFHNIQDEQILNSVRIFLDNIAKNTHLVIISRSVPPIPCTKLKMWDEVVELSYDDLKFSSHEVRDFLCNKMGLELSCTELKVLYDKTAGWITAVKIVAISLKKESGKKDIMTHLNNSYRSLLEYLFVELLSEYPEDIQSFLIQTSVLETLNPSLCNYVLNRANALDILEKLMKHHLFIDRLDESNRNYRYHLLFSELLKQELLMRYPALLEELYLRASTWCEKNDFLHDAINYSIKSGNEKNTERLFKEYGIRILEQCDFIKFIEYIDNLPDPILKNPLICLYYATALTYTKKLDPDESILRNKGILLDDEIYSAYRAELYVVRAISHFNYGKFEKAKEFSDQAIRMINPESRFRGYAYYNASCILSVSGQINKANEMINEAISESGKYRDINLTTMAICHKAYIYYFRLKLSDSLFMLENTLKYMSGQNEMILSATTDIYLLLGALYYELDEIKKAEHFINKAIQNANVRNDESAMVQAYIFLAKKYCKEKENEKAGEYLRLSWNRCSKKTLGFLNYQRLIDLIRTAMAIGNKDLAEEIVARAPDIINKSLDFFNDFALSELLIAEKRYTEALEIMEKISKRDFREMNYLLKAYVSNQYALIFYGLNNKKKALYYIKKVIEVTLKAGFIRTVADYGADMYHLLLDFIEAEGRNSSPDQPLIDYAKKLVSHFDLECYDKNQLDAPCNLSKREVEVLRCLSSGDTNQEIASSLYLSTNTVKKHLNNIFEKLNVKNRIQAVKVFKNLSLE